MALGGILVMLFALGMALVLISKISGTGALENRGDSALGDSTGGKRFFLEMDFEWRLWSIKRAAVSAWDY